MFSASVQIVFEFMDNGVKIIEFATYVRKMFYFWINSYFLCLFRLYYSWVASSYICSSRCVPSDMLFLLKSDKSPERFHLIFNKKQTNKQKNFPTCKIIHAPPVATRCKFQFAFLQLRWHVSAGSGIWSSGHLLTWLSKSEPAGSAAAQA